MKFFKRVPREFKVVIGSPWTINGKPTEAANPRDVLAEIYDIAVYFPITITVTGPDVSTVLEMDENGNTSPVESVSKTPDEDTSSPSVVPEDPAEEVPEEVALEDLVVIESHDLEAEEAPSAARWDDSEEHKPSIASALKGKKLFISIGGALVAIALIIGVITQVVGIGGTSEEAQASSADERPWQTPMPETATADESLDSDFSSRLWTIEPGEADQVSWFAAGVIALDGNKIRLLSHLTGEEIATHTLEKVDLDEELRWVAEFYHQDEPAIGLRIADTFVAMTANGEIQEWEVPEGIEIGVYGTTPTMTNTSSVEAGDDVTWQALHIGEDDPVDLTVNPSMATRAVDGDWIVQLEGGSPRVALNPVDRSNEETTAHAVTLTTPNESAEFIRHLDAGHGHAMALWKVSGDLYVGVHPLEGANAGEAATFVSAPFTEEEATGWAMARGMELTIIGPYAISLETGELVAYSDSGEFTRGYGPAAVTSDENDRRIFIVDNTEYTETNRIIGYTGRGTILVRLTDGSVAAYGANGGTS